MFLSISLYFIFLFLLWWAFCGYVYIIYLFSLFKGKDKNIEIKSYPSVSVLIPCHNEEDFVEKKINSLKNINYPIDKLKIYFLDGLSTDKTVDRLNELTKDAQHIKVIQTNCKGKINQINSLLPNIDSDIVVNNDMDAIMDANTIIELMKEFARDKDVYVVGAFISPENCIDLEKHYWETQNWLRVFESRVYSASAVMAPCFAFRRELLNNFPQDCIADDIYISYLANYYRKKVKYCVNTVVYETRCPSTVESLINHKFRKANAYIVELLRFSYLLPRMSNKWKVIYSTKMLQILLIPWIVLFFGISSISFLLSGPATVNIVIFAFAFLFISLLLAHYLIEISRKKIGLCKYKKGSSIAVFLLTNLILFFAGITYPFFSQDSSYKKINN